MFAYGDLVQWFKDRCSDQVSRRNRAWDFGREHGLEPCEVASTGAHTQSVKLIFISFPVRSTITG